MWAFIGLVLLTVSVLLSWARHSVFLEKYNVRGGSSIRLWTEKTFLKGTGLFDPAAKHALVVTWLQAPAFITGFLEEMPWGGDIAHFIEFALFVGLFFWKKQSLSR